MLGPARRKHRSLSSVQLPSDFSATPSPVSVFHYTTKDFVFDLRNPPKRQCNQDREDAHNQDLLDSLQVRWESAREKNAINYNLNCMYKCLDGQFNLTIQLNVERGELRRKPMRFRHISEPFNNVRWNYSKLHENEVLLSLKRTDRPLSSDPLDRHIIAVNASPLERNHALILPSVNKCLPQVLNSTALRLGTDVMLLFRDEMQHVLFNSLLGQASVNHLHLHSVQWPYDSDIIYRKFERGSASVPFFVIHPPAWICQAFAFQLVGIDDLDSFLWNLETCVSVLLRREQAHNVFFSRAAPLRTEGPEREEDRERRRPLLVTAFVFPRLNMTGAKPPTNFNPAALELAGCLTSYTWRFFESVTETSAVRIIEEEAQLPESLFSSLVEDVKDALEGRNSSSDPSISLTLSQAGLTSPELDELRDSFSNFAPSTPLFGTRRKHSSSVSAPAFPLPDIPQIVLP